MSADRKVVHGDEAFERFRRKLADVVTVAINGGRRVTSDSRKWFALGGGFGCPLGCVFTDAQVADANYRLAPVAGMAAGPWGLTIGEAMEFMIGFGDCGNIAPTPYFELGRLYRERFP